MARRRFFVDAVHSGRAQIAGDDAHHLTRVLRVEPGQMYEISDNRQVYLASIEAARKDLVSFTIVERLPPDEPRVQIALYASLVRFEKFELMLEKATELGVAHIAPVAAERSEKGLDRAAIKRSARWLRILREAGEQSRRTSLPQLDVPLRFTQALRSAPGLRYLLDEDSAAKPILDAIPAQRTTAQQVSLLVGPEGGWSARERAAAIEAGWSPVSLGPSILKAETAVIAALAILSAAWQAQRSPG